jgi:hypothetical protein
MAFSQEESTTDEKPVLSDDDYLPASGDIAIGVDALPYIEFLGNMFSGHDARNMLFLGSSTIYGKYFLSSDAAIRGELYINQRVNTDVAYVQDDANFNTNPRAEVEDMRTIRNNGVGVGLGYQQYRGYNKLRGTYGVVASYFLNKPMIEYQWGNEMSPSNTNPSSTNWYGAGSNPSDRNLEVKDGGSQTIGAGVFAGVEYFFLPKICIGGELGLYYSYTIYDQEYYKYQTVEEGAYQEYDQADEPEESLSNLSTRVYDQDNVAGRLYLLFHF